MGGGGNQNSKQTNTEIWVEKNTAGYDSYLDFNVVSTSEGRLRQIAMRSGDRYHIKIHICGAAAANGVRFRTR